VLLAGESESEAFRAFAFRASLPASADRREQARHQKGLGWLPVYVEHRLAGGSAAQAVRKMTYGGKGRMSRHPCDMCRLLRNFPRRMLGTKQLPRP